jgi:hypothetical protein
VAHTITLLGDHKGYTRSRVNGAEYVVDAAIDITTYDSAGDVGELITASELGLSSITAVEITGQEAVNGIAAIRTDSSGDYESSSSFKILFLQPSATPQLLEEEADDTNIGIVRVRAYGNL